MWGIVHKDGENIEFAQDGVEGKVGFEIWECLRYQARRETAR